MRVLLFAGVLLATGACHADECKTFALDVDPDVKITDNVNTLTITDKFGTRTMTVVISSYYGQLMSAAIESKNAGAREHPYQYVEINGEQKLIYDSQIFNPACSIAK